ncbi:hypothetical protein [Paenibacillus hamazuiensis]|uniref:hypothetical protein n=1 Tax=Paenibacillus hamazuiensis TaxID=2936508 RepID=UPI00200E1ED9|nr:hypothetical protein [Paenibacillus hamazuiensis]
MKQNAKTEAQHDLNHALHALNDARKSNDKEDLQAAQELLDQAQLAHLQAKVNDTP